MLSYKDAFELDAAKTICTCFEAAEALLRFENSPENAVVCELEINAGEGYDWNLKSPLEKACDLKYILLTEKPATLKWNHCWSG